MTLVVKTPDSFDLIGQNNVYISNIFLFLSMECRAPKIEARKKIIRFGNKKFQKMSNVITYNIYDICNIYKQIHLQFLFTTYIKIMAGFHSTKTNEEHKEIKKCKY